MVYKARTYFKKIIFVFTVMMLFSIKANADCSYIELARLNDVAGKIRANYEIVEKAYTEEHIDPDGEEIDIVEVIKSTFKISIYNITEDIYIVATNDLDRNKEYITAEDATNGVYSFVSENRTDIVKYEFKVYANNEECSTKVLKSYNFIKPKINNYSQYTICDGLDDLPFCKKYLTEELNASLDDLDRQVADYLNKTNKKEEETKKGFFKKNYIYIIVGVGVVGVSSTGVYFYIKKRRAV